MSEFTGWGRKHDIDFGDYIKYPTGYSRDMHIYKVVGALCSNTYQDVPAVYNSENRIHGEIVPVLRVIHCGVDEREVITVRLSDCALITEPYGPPLTREELLHMDGEPVWCVDSDGKKAWCLIDVTDWDAKSGPQKPNGIDNDTEIWDGDWYNFRDNDGKLDGNGWVAYRRKGDQL